MVSQAKCFLMLIGACLFLMACASDAAKSVSLTVWIPAHPNESVFFQRLLNRYQQRHPQVHLKLVQVPFEVMKPRFVGEAQPKREPDILLMPNDWTGELSHAKLLQPQQASTQDFLAPALAAFRYQDTLYALPLSFQVAALIRNQDLVPKAPSTWDEVKTVSQALQRQGHQGLMYDTKSFYYHAAWFHAFGGHLTPQGARIQISPVPLQQSLNFVRDLEHAQLIAPRASYSVMTHLFNAGQLGMMVSGPWALSEARRNQLKVAVSPLPTLPKGMKPRPFLGAKGWGLNAYSRHSHTASELIRWLSSLEVQQEMLNTLDELGSHPALYQHKALSPEKQGFFLQAQTAVPLPNHPAMKNIWAELNWTLSQTLSTQRPTAAIVTEAMKRLQRL
jgi:maltose/maltodextrin transport system substrate-binding protein